MSSSTSSSNNNYAYDKEFEYPYCDDVEKYDLVKRIGKGTFGEVFRARHKVTKKEVALKKILMDNEQEGFPITAIREIKILKQYKNINTVNLIEVCRSTQRVHNNAISYLVFEFCHHDLAGLIQESHDKIRSLPLIKCIVKQLLEGIHMIHQNKIIHRDMKSSNILITKDGILKIADFGLARPFSAYEKTRKYTNRVVTLWYRPPELLLGERNYDTAVDIWGIGCIMSELFCKTPIMKGESEIKQLELIVEFLGPITPEVWPNVEEYPIYKKLSKTLSRQSRKRLFKDLRSQTTDVNALSLLEKLLTLDPSKRISATDALDHDFFWDEDNKVASIKELAESLSSISQSQFEYTTRKRPAANHNNIIASHMVNRGNNHRPIAHRPGPSNNDGQYRDHVY